MSGDSKECDERKDGELSSKIEYDERIDFFSDKFDPLFALSVKNITIPISKAKTYDNLSAYQRAQQKPSSSVEQAQKVKTKENLTESSTVVAGTSDGRRFLPHQMPVPSKRKKLKNNIFTRMEKMEGPLKLLTRCVVEKLRIKINVEWISKNKCDNIFKLARDNLTEMILLQETHIGNEESRIENLLQVWTRNAHNVRGYCTAYVTAFDKHWNLALLDITEVWTRPAKRKTVALDADKGVSHRSVKKVKPPPITILKATKKQEVCSRKVDQYILRGEHVVLIALHEDK